MKALARIARLEMMSALMRDRRLEELRAAARECSELRAELQQLAGAAHAAPATGDELRNAFVIARHEEWCAARRRELHIRLAAAIARRIACQAAAAEAVGRHATVVRLRNRHGPRGPKGD